MTSPPTPQGARPEVGIDLGSSTPSYSVRQIVVYKPCAVCRGNGYTPWMPTTPYTPGEVFQLSTAHVVATCSLCNGTGRGPIESIREETP